MPKEHLRILGVVAHPHDFTHMAATCGIHVKDGDLVTIVCVTPGGSTHNTAVAAELAKPRDQQNIARIEAGKAS